MNWQTLPYLIPYLVSLAISIGVGVYAWRRRDVHGATSYALFALTEASMTLGYLFELPSLSLEAKIFWDNGQFVGMLVAPMAFLAFALQYTGHKLPHPRRTWGLLAIVPIVSLLLVFTDDWHGLVRPVVWLVPGEPFSALVYDFSLSFWAMSIYVYVLTLSGLLMLIGKFIRPHRLYRAQVGVVILGVLIPMVGGALTLVGITLTFQRDTTPITFAIGNLIVAWGLFHYRLFDLVPVARDMVIDSMSDVVIVLDAQSRIVDFNPAAQEVVGPIAPSAVGQPAAQVFTNWPDLIERYQDVEETHIEIRIDVEDVQHHFDLRLSPLRDRRGRLTGRLVVLRDITDRVRAEEALQKAHAELEQRVEERTAELAKVNAALRAEITDRVQAETALRESEERFRSLVETTRDWIWETDQNGVYTYASPIVKNILGYQPEELIGKTPFDLMAPDEAERVSAIFRDAMTSQGPMERFEKVNLHKDGRRVVLETSGVPILAADGEILGYRGIDRDITERVQAEETLRENEQRYRALFERTNDAVFILSLEDVYLAVNQQAADLLGYTADELVGMSVEQVVAPYEYPDSQNKLAAVLAGESLPIYERIFCHKDGTEIPVEVNVALAYDPTGQPLHIQSIVRDISERKRVEEALEERVAERTAELAAVNKELEAFAYSVSHDLRAPLRSIDGFSLAVLKDYADKLDAVGQDHLRRVREASQRMGRLIADLLNLSRLTRREMRHGQVDLSRVAREIAVELGQREPERRVEFVIAEGVVTKGDARLLRVALQNLLGNAWKFTGKRTCARIEFGYTQVEGKPAYFVRDDGAGFDMAYADKLFGAFQRLHAAAEYEGTGIGLATVQRILHRHGGRVWAEGAVDQGATFYFTL